MAIIKTKVPNFNGYRASVLFTNGVGKTDNPKLIEWFENHGYIVENDSVDKKDDSKPLEQMSIDEIRDLAKSQGIFVGNTKNRDVLIGKLKEVM